MAVPAVIAAVAETYHFNNGFLEKTVKDLSPEEWLKRPGDNMNHVAWLVGHVAWARRQLVGRLGAPWSRPDLDIYGRGVKLAEDAAYPSPESLLDTWRASAAVLAVALEEVSEDFLAQPAPQPGPRSTDGKLSGVVNFLAIHESYHLGQASYLRSWMGHKGLMG